MRSYDDYKKNLKVLFVKTDSYSRKISLKALERNFENITVAHNGLDGLMKFMESRKDEDTKFDLIISDINLEKLNGIEMLEKIRGVDDTPFIFLTINNNYKIVLKAVRLHILSYIVKPLDLNLYETINNSCKKLYKEYLSKEKIELV